MAFLLYEWILQLCLPFIHLILGPYVNYFSPLSSIPFNINGIIFLKSFKTKLGVVVVETDSSFGDCKDVAAGESEPFDEQYSVGNRMKKASWFLFFFKERLAWNYA